MKVLKNMLTKRQLLALLNKKHKCYEEVFKSSKEWYTLEEYWQMIEFDPFPRYPAVGNNGTAKGCYNAHIAEDDLIRSYDNNFGELR